MYDFLDDEIFDTYIKKLGYDKLSYHDIDFTDNTIIKNQYKKADSSIYIGVYFDSGIAVAYYYATGCIIKYTNDLIEVEGLFYKILLSIGSESIADAYLKDRMMKNE